MSRIKTPPQLLVEDPAVASEASSRLDALERVRRGYELALEAGGDGFWDWDLSTDTVHYSAEWKALLGFEAQRIGTSPKEWLDRVHAEDRARVDTEWNAHIEGTTPCFASECRMLHRDGTPRWVRLCGLVERDAHGRPRRVAGILRDVSERKSAEAMLRQGAFYDTLTGLPNRAVLMDRLGRAIELVKRRGDYIFALLFCDLDGFKRINDSLGHAVGDQLLISVARRLETCIRTVDTLARLGGDEFAIILDNIRDVSDALRVAERIHAALERPIELAGQEISVHSSVGIALSVAGYDRSEEIVRDADIAMYRAKSGGTARHEIFDRSMHDQAVDRLKLEGELRRAMERNELRVHYQPIVCIPTGEITGFEALVRWQHPEHGLVPPARFIPLAEETGMIIQLDRWVLREACYQTKAWQEKYPRKNPLSISVNLSPRQLMHPGLVEQIRTTLSDSRLDPTCFRPEITESVLMEDLDAATTILEQLRGMNVLLHIDDFGTGYSSLSYLIRFRVSTLKIDGSFVTHMAGGGESVEIVRMIINLAHNLGMKVIAEGVETEEQLNQLRRLNCEFAQGYYFSKALPVEEMELRLAADVAWPDPRKAGVD